MLVDVCHKNSPLFFLWKSIGLVDSRTSMSRSMTMISDGLDVFIHKRIEMLPALTVVNSTWNHMPEMRNHTGAHKKLSFGVVVNSPGITEAMGHNFKSIFNRVVAPHTAVDVHSLFFKKILRKGVFVVIKFSISAWFADFGRGSKTLQTVKPTIRTPMQAV